jgi:hypothetical protein
MKKDYLELTMSFSVEGKIKGQKIVNGKTKSGLAFDLEDIARMYAMGEVFLKSSGTGLDYFLSEYADFFQAKEEDVAKLTQKYWHNRKATFEEHIKNSNTDTELFGGNGLYAEHLLSSALGGFYNLPIDLRRAFFEFIFRYSYDSNNESRSEILEDCKVSGDFEKLIQKILTHQQQKKKE